MEECPPGGDCASGEGDPSKSDNPPASWTPNPAGEQTQSESVSRGDDASQAASHSPELKRKKDSSTSGPMTEWHQAALVALQGSLKLNVKMIQLSDMLERPAGGFMDRAEALSVKAKAGDMEQMGELINILLGKEDMAFYTFCDLLQRSNYEVWARELKSAAERLKTVGATSIGSAVSPSDHSSDLESYKLDIVSCDLSVVASKKNPQDAIKSLFFNAYSLLVHILGTCFNTIKAVALDAVRMKQVAASRERVMEVSDVSSLFECLEIDKKWDDLHFLDVAISRLPPATKAAARLVLGHYKSHLSAYTKAVSIKEAKNVFGIFCRKRDREGKSVVTEITVDKEIDEYTCYDCLNLWKKFLVAKLEIPEGSIQFHDARPGNSTILLFTVPNSCVERLEKKLSQPDVMWTMKELDILRVIVVGMLNVDMYNVIPAVHIREGLQSGVNFIALTKVSPPLMYSLLDQVPEPKETQPGSIQPYSAGPAEQSALEPVVEAASSVSVVKDLLVAAAKGRLLKVQSLLDGGRCRVNDEDEEGLTAILIAALYGHLPVLRTLVERYGGNLLHREKGGHNAFLLCAMGSHRAVAEYLAPKMEGHLFDSDDDGHTALHIAAYFGQLSIVEYLVGSCGFDVKAIDKRGRNAFHLCAMKGHLAVAEYLAPKMEGHLFDSDDDGHTALHLAAYFGQWSIGEYLVRSCGFDV